MGDIRAIVAGHGTFADGMISAVQQIAGRGEVFEGVTNRDLSAQRVEEVMRERVASTGVEVIFTDLPAGSCTMAARRLQRDRPDLTIVTGANLATLLDFVFHVGEKPGDAARHAAEKGRNALAAVGASRGA
jgi:PTS system N-acetylgalactosamine-specific IIA component